LVETIQNDAGFRSDRAVWAPEGGGLPEQTGRLPGKGSIGTHQRYAGHRQGAELPVLIAICILKGGTLTPD
jgi:hypothetical protein